METYFSMEHAKPAEQIAQHLQNEIRRRIQS